MGAVPGAAGECDDPERGDDIGIGTSDRDGEMTGPQVRGSALGDRPRLAGKAARTGWTAPIRLSPVERTASADGDLARQGGLRLRQGKRQHPVLEVGADLVLIDIVGEGE